MGNEEINLLDYKIFWPAETGKLEKYLKEWCLSYYENGKHSVESPGKADTNLYYKSGLRTSLYMTRKRIAKRQFDKQGYYMVGEDDTVSGKDNTWIELELKNGESIFCLASDHFILAKHELTAIKCSLRDWMGKDFVMQKGDSLAYRTFDGKLSGRGKIVQFHFNDTRDGFYPLEETFIVMPGGPYQHRKSGDAKENTETTHKQMDALSCITEDSCETTTFSFENIMDHEPRAIFNARMEFGSFNDWISGLNPFDFVESLVEVDKLAEFIQKARQYENEENQKEVDKLEEFAKKYLDKALTFDDIKNLNIQLSVDNIICHEWEEIPDDDIPFC